MKAATILQIAQLFHHKISIHAAREGGDALKSLTRKGYLISIHAAREGGDTALTSYGLQGDISIHAAREGGD